MSAPVRQHLHERHLAWRGSVSGLFTEVRFLDGWPVDGHHARAGLLRRTRPREGRSNTGRSRRSDVSETSPRSAQLGLFLRLCRTQEPLFELSHAHRNLLVNCRELCSSSRTGLRLEGNSSSRPWLPWFGPLTTIRSRRSRRCPEVAHRSRVMVSDCVSAALMPAL
jgi:hypothetical protein